jgi:hypothetical protein
MVVFVICVPLWRPEGIAASPDRYRTYTVTPETAQAIEEAAPDAADVPGENRSIRIVPTVPAVHTVGFSQ